MNRALLVVQTKATALERARRERDAAIIAARAAGLTLREIALAAGTTHRTVSQVIERHR